MNNTEAGLSVITTHPCVTVCIVPTAPLTLPQGKKCSFGPLCVSVKFISGEITEGLRAISNFIPSKWNGVNPGIKFNEVCVSLREVGPGLLFSALSLTDVINHLL